MYQGYLSSLSSQWLCIYVNWTLSGIDELIPSQQAQNQARVGQDCGVLRVGVEAWIWFTAAEIFDASIQSLFYSLTIVTKICNFDSARD